jgi:hypothetical protein
MFDRLFAMVFNAVESALRPPSGILKLAMVVLLLVFHELAQALVAGR